MTMTGTVVSIAVVATSDAAVEATGTPASAGTVVAAEAASPPPSSLLDSSATTPASRARTTTTAPAARSKPRRDDRSGASGGADARSVGAECTANKDAVAASRASANSSTDW